MDTYMSLSAYGDGANRALTEAGQAINELDSRLSRTRPDSDIGRLNLYGSAEIDPDTAALLERSADYVRKTGGRFEITVGPLVELWGITTDEPRVPEQEEIDACLARVGSEHLRVQTGEPTAAALDPGCAVDLGAVAKGYASDKVAEIFTARGVESGAVSLGGNVYVRGSRPDGTPWSVAVQDPAGEGYACTLALTDAFAVTSGGYQRFFTAGDGTVYSHILDPDTGYPAQSDLLSATVIADCGAMADAYSTALYVMGSGEAADFWRGQSDFDMVLITADGRLLYTPALADKISPQEKSPYVYEAITP